MIAGIDEAGSGPVIGPLTMGMVLCNQEQLDTLKSLGVDDSKKLTAKKREYLSKLIKKNVDYFDIKIASAEKVDNYKFDSKTNLNSLKRDLIFDLISPVKLKISFLQIDKMGKNNFKDNFKHIINGKIICEIKGDSKYVAIGAASILAKVERDKIINRISEQIKQKDPELPPMGSGYPADKYTIKFLDAYFEKYNQFEPYVRKSWDTIMRYEKDKQQSGLDDF